MDNLFLLLKGEQLSSVIFVQNYLQLDFDGHTLTCYDWPLIYSKGAIYKFGESEYRNVICTFISRIVEDVIFIDGASLDIYFSAGDKISVDLTEKDKEIIYFTTPSGEWSAI